MATDSFGKNIFSCLMLGFLSLLLGISQEASANPPTTPPPSAWDQAFPPIKFQTPGGRVFFAKFLPYQGRLNLNEIIRQSWLAQSAYYRDSRWRPLTDQLYQIWRDAELNPDKWPPPPPDHHGRQISGNKAFDPRVIMVMDEVIIEYFQSKFSEEPSYLRELGAGRTTPFASGLAEGEVNVFDPDSSSYKDLMERLGLGRSKAGDKCSQAFKLISHN
jgi:hypothetical protein